MSKIIDLEYYQNFYDYKQTHCMHLPVANAAGLYKYENYFFHLFLYSLSCNWGISDMPQVSGMGWEEQSILETDDILKKLGLSYNSVTIETSEELIRMVKECIDKDTLVVFYTIHKYLFYHMAYGWESDRLFHNFLINGYDSEYSYFYLREEAHINYSGAKNIKGLFTLRFTEDMLKDLWVKSNSFFYETHPYAYNKIFIINKNGIPKIEDYHSLLVNAINTCNLERNLFIIELDKYDYRENNHNAGVYIDALRRKFYWSVYIIFNILEKALSRISDENIELKANFLQLQRECLEFRNLTITKLYMHSLREKNISAREKNAIKCKIIDGDKELFAFMKEIIRNI